MRLYRERDEHEKMRVMKMVHKKEVRKWLEDHPVKKFAIGDDRNDIIE